MLILHSLSLVQHALSGFTRFYFPFFIYQRNKESKIQSFSFNFLYSILIGGPVERLLHLWMCLPWFSASEAI